MPSVTGINDYFVWGGEDTISTLSIEGKFRQSRLYKFIGTGKSWKWEVDDDIGHGTFALSDVLGIADADLQQNNSQAWEYLYHLTSNSVYADMIVANTAFIDKVTAAVVAVGDLITVGDAHAYTDDAIDDYIADTGIDRNYVVIQNGKITAGLIDTNAIKATAGFFNDITVQGTLISADFNVAQNKGYKLSQTNGIGVAEIPLLKCANLTNIHGTDQALYCPSGLTAAYHSSNNSGIINNWVTLISALFPGNQGTGSANLVHVSGFIGSIVVDRLTVLFDSVNYPPFVSIYGYQWGSQVYSYNGLTFPTDAPTIIL